MLVSSLIVRHLLVASLMLLSASCQHPIYGYEALTCQDDLRGNYILTEKTSSVIICTDWRDCKYRICACDMEIEAGSEQWTLEYELRNNPRRPLRGPGTNLCVFDENNDTMLVSH